MKIERQIFLEIIEHTIGNVIRNHNVVYHNVVYHNVVYHNVSGVNLESIVLLSI